MVSSMWILKIPVFPSTTQDPGLPRLKKKNVLRDANSWFDKPLIALWQEFHKIIYVEHLEIAQHIVGTPSYFPTPTPLW